MDFAKSFLIKLDQRLNHSFQNINILDHNVQMKILSRNLSFAVDLDKQKLLYKSESKETEICEISVFTDFLILVISNVDFIRSFPTEVNQSKPKCLKCELCHYTYKCGLYQKTYLKKWVEVNKRFLRY